MPILGTVVVGTLGPVCVEVVCVCVCVNPAHAVGSCQEVYSCGSLAPKLRKGGCMDHGHSRKKEPWEATDGGCILQMLCCWQLP